MVESLSSMHQEFHSIPSVGKQEEDKKQEQKEETGFWRKRLKTEASELSPGESKVPYFPSQM